MRYPWLRFGITTFGEIWTDNLERASAIKVAPLSNSSSLVASLNNALAWCAAFSIYNNRGASKKKNRKWEKAWIKLLIKNNWSKFQYYKNILKTWQNQNQKAN